MIPSAVFFDMDGTLIDSEPIWFASEQELMSKFGYVWTEEDQKESIGGPLMRVGNMMAQKSNSNNPPEYFAEELISLASKNFQAQLRFMPGALELLARISEMGIPTALVTASPKGLASAAENALPKPYFNLVVSADDVKNTKPDPECYIKAARDLGVDISKCLILEDTNTGVTSAVASGAYVVAIPHLVPIFPQPKVVVIETLQNLTVEQLFSLH